MAVPRGCPGTAEDDPVQSGCTGCRLRFTQGRSVRLHWSLCGSIGRVSGQAAATLVARLCSSTGRAGHEQRCRTFGVLAKWSHHFRITGTGPVFAAPAQS